MPKKKSEVIHVGIEYPEALASKKQILLSESNLLEVIKRIRNYSKLRKREFILKNRIKKELISIKSVVKEIEEELPESEDAGIEKADKPKLKELDIDIEEIKAEQQKELKKEIKKEKESQENVEIEKELADIREKLAKLE